MQTEALTPAASSALAGSLADACGASKDDIKVQVVGPTWGEEISKKALQGLIVFDWLPRYAEANQALLEAKRPAEAEAVYRTSLKTYRDDGWALTGLAQALDLQGKTAEAGEVRKALAAAWAGLRCMAGP